GSPQETIKLQFSSFLGPSIPQSVAIEWMFDQIEERTNGAIEIERFWEGALLEGPATLQGVADNRADLAYTTASYNPSQLPLTMVISVPFITQDVPALQHTYTELYETNADFKAEWDATGVMPLVFIGVPPVATAATTEITGPDWFNGKSIRATGYTGNAIQAMGGNPVALGIAEVYESVQRGLIDGYTSNTFDNIPPLSLEEVAPYITDIGLGAYTVNSIIMHPDAWAEIPEEYQKIITEVAGEFP